MPFSGAGRINAVSKRGLGAEIIAVPTDQSLNSNEEVFNVYQSLPGTGVLTNTAGPRPYFIPYQSNQFKSVVSPSGTYLVTIASSYPFAVIYKKVNGLWTLLNGNIAASYSSIISAAWSPDESTLVLITNTPTIYVFTRSGDTFTYNNNFSLGYASNMCAYDQTGQYFGVVSNSTPYITIYSVSGTTFTKLSNPATLPTNAAYYLSWSSANNLLAVGGATSPYINVYSYSGSGTGTVFTKLVNPGTLPGSNVNTLAFNNTASGAISTASLAVGPTSGLPIVYNLNLAGTLTSFVNTVTLANVGGCNEVTWNSDGTSLFFAGGNSPILFGFNRTGVNTYTTISNIISTATATGGFSNATGAGVIWNTNTNHLISISDSIPGITELSRSGNTFTDVDCWGRNAQGYNIQSYVISNNVETIGRWNPGGSNYAGTILATSQASALIPFYYNNNGGGQGTYTQIVTTFTATSVGTILDMAWSPNGQLLAVYGNTSPYINAYLVTGVGTATTFTKLSQTNIPGLVPAPAGGNSGQLSWSPDSSILMVAGSNTAPYIGWYAVTGTGLSTTFAQGTYTQFTSTVSAATIGAAISPDGTILALTASSNVKFYTIAYNGTASTFTNNIGSPPISLTNTPQRLSWSPNGQYLAASHNSSAATQSLYVLQRIGSSNTYTSVTPTISSLNAQLSSPVWSADSSRVYCFVEGTGAMAATQYPGISMLTRSNSTTTWVYTTATSVNIDYPTQSYYNIDIKYDY